MNEFLLGHFNKENEILDIKILVVLMNEFLLGHFNPYEFGGYHFGNSFNERIPFRSLQH